VAEETVIAEWAKASEGALAKLQAAGMTLVEVDVQSIIDAGAGLYKDFLTPENQALFEDMQQVR
jgi:TRAP-type C4-dicarboxylate transport system substrate-binding protein